MRRPFLLALAALGAVFVVLIARRSADLVCGDEVVYAAAAREVAHGRPPLAFGIAGCFVRRFGFPVREIHAGGGVQLTALLFRALGESTRTALLPAALATIATVLASVAVARRAGCEGGLAGASVAVFPTTAAFALSAFYEPWLALACVLGAASVLARSDRERVLLAALAGGIGVAWRETMLALPLPLGLATLVVLAGRDEPRARMRALFPALAALAAGAVALATFSGNHLAPRGPVLPWYVLAPILPPGRDECTAAALGEPAPVITPGLVLWRAAVSLPRIFVEAGALPGSATTLVLVHLVALLAAFGLGRKHSPEVRALAAFALVGYAIQVGFHVVVYEAPALFARAFAPQAAPLVLAAVAAWAPRLAPRARWIVGALVLLGALALDARIAGARAAIRTEVARGTTALARHAPETGVVFAGFEYRLAWDRPGLFLVGPPATQPALAWLSSQVPAQRLVLVPGDELMAPALAAGGVPRRLGPFKLLTVDRSEAGPIFVYERAP